MKKVVVLLFILLAAYIAGMYRLRSMVLLFFMGCFLFIGFFIISRIGGRRISAAFTRRIEFAQPGSAVPCRIRFSNTGRYFTGKLSARLRFGYVRKTATKRTRVDAGAVFPGEYLGSFDVIASYCGLIRVSIRGMYAYDIITLFRKKIKVQDEMYVAVLPPEQAVLIEISSDSNSSEIVEQYQNLSLDGEPQRDVRELRTYSYGDSDRHIHWSQSAKTDITWVKEFEKEKEKSLLLVLDRSEAGNLSETEWNNYYVVLHAIIKALMRASFGIRVCWYDCTMRDVSVMNVENTEDCRNLLVLLYHAESGKTDNTGERGFEKMSNELYPDSLCLNMRLELSSHGKTMHRFSGDGLTEDRVYLRLVK